MRPFNAHKTVRFCTFAQEWGLARAPSVTIGASGEFGARAPSVVRVCINSGPGPAWLRRGARRPARRGPGGRAGARNGQEFSANMKSQAIPRGIPGFRHVFPLLSAQWQHSVARKYLCAGCGGGERGLTKDLVRRGSRRNSCCASPPKTMVLEARPWRKRSGNEE